VTVQSSTALPGQAVSQEVVPPPATPLPNERQHTPVVHDIAVQPVAAPELLVVELDAVLPVDPELDWVAPAHTLGATQASTFCPLSKTKQHCWGAKHVMPPQEPLVWPALLVFVPALAVVACPDGCVELPLEPVP
jgi:hypothetical protein